MANEMRVLLRMNSIPCKDCGQVWIHFDQSVRYHSSGKCMPLDENNQRHDFRDCLKSRFNLNRQSKIRGKFVKKEELKKIDDYSRIEAAKLYIKNTNARLSNYELVLSIKQLRPILGEEV
jgi:hypothetical protein